MAVAEQEADVVAGLVERQADEMSGQAEQGVSPSLLEDLAAHHRRVLADTRERGRERLEAAQHHARDLQQGFADQVTGASR